MKYPGVEGLSPVAGPDLSHWVTSHSTKVQGILTTQPLPACLPVIEIAQLLAGPTMQPAVTLSTADTADTADTAGLAQPYHIIIY